MAFLLANDIPILSARMTFPRVGVWSAQIEIDSEEELSGKVALSTENGEITWNGTITRGSTFLGRASYFLLGGAGTLQHAVTAKFYEGSPLRLPVQDLLVAVGELLSPLSDQEALSFLLSKWGSIERSAGSLLTLLCGVVDGLLWRVLRSGEVWVGKDTYPEFSGDYVLIDENTISHTADIDLDFPSLQPGVTLEDKKVSRVVYELTDNKLITKVWYEL
jgi:hypothetical protein